MIPELALHGFAAALATATGIAAWWRKDSDEEQQVLKDAADMVLGALSDADATRTVDCRTGHNWRDSVSIGEAIEINEERELRGMGWRRN
jgi:hypothetical protein